MGASPADTGNPYGPWWGHRLVIFDVETTGLGADDRIVEIGAARFEGGELVDSWGSIVNPMMEIPEEATAVHGISTVDAAAAPPFIGAVGPLLRLARNAWPVAYNATFDRRFWFTELTAVPIGPFSTPLFNPAVPWLDPMVWVRKEAGVWSGNKLAQACDRYSIDIPNAHRATDDAVAAGKLLLAMRERLHPITISEMLRRQAIFHERQRGELRSWFNKKGYEWHD